MVKFKSQNVKSLSKVGLVTYITIDATSSDDNSAGIEVVESVRICSNANAPHTAENQEFEWTELDKYVWAKDESYRWEISKFNCDYCLINSLRCQRT